MPSAFQKPFLDARLISCKRITELLALVKPVPMWAALFFLLEPSAGQKEMVGSSSATGWSSVEERAAIAVTPAKQAPLPDSVSPPSLVLTGLPDSASDAELCPLLSKNFDQLQQSFDVMARDLAQVKAQSEHQAATIALLLDKINLLAGFVCTPDPSLTTPTLWQATHTTYNWLLELKSKMQEPSNNNQSDIEGLVKALELDHKAGLQRIAFLEAKQVETTQSLKKAIMLDQIEEFLPGVGQEELISELRKIEPLLLCTQQFLDHTLPSLSLSATIRINKLGLSSMGDSMQEDISLQEFRELASTIQATQAEHSALVCDLQARAEDSVIDIEGERFPSLSFVTAYVNTNNIAPLFSQNGRCHVAS